MKRGKVVTVLETRLAEFKVRNIGLAARCEVCHQDDLFNPETGECARCRGAMAALSAPSTESLPEFVSNTPVSPSGLRLTQIATILSTIMAIPGIGGVLLCLFLFLNSLSNTASIAIPAISFLSLMFMGGGYYLLYWYWRILRFATESDQRQWLWFLSTVYNLLLLLGITFFLQERVMDGEPLCFLWLSLVGVMTVISGLAFLEEFRPR